jgi:hypothetical protein
MMDPLTMSLSLSFQASPLLKHSWTALRLWCCPGVERSLAALVIIMCTLIYPVVLAKKR